MFNNNLFSLCRLLFRVIRQEVFPSDVLKARALEREGTPYCVCLQKTTVKNDSNPQPIEPVCYSHIQANNHNNNRS